MKRILVPTDFSPNALSALRVAVDIASRVRGTLILYHAYTPLERTPIDYKIERKERNKEMEAIILKRLQRLKKKVVVADSQVTISIIVGRSPLVSNILGFAERNHIDLIVMGTKGASGIKKVLVGSVAAKVVGKSKAPVLLIPENSESDQFEQIVFASDYHPSDQQALSFTLEFAKLYHTSVLIVHLISADISGKKMQKEENDFEGYAYYMQRKFVGYNPKFQLLEIKAGKSQTEALCSEMDYNLLVMVRGQKSYLEKIFTGSWTQSSALIAERPLLIMPSVENLAEHISLEELKEENREAKLADRIIIKKIKQEVKN